MCGIAGIMTADGSAPALSVIGHMARALQHRGPDGEGRHVLDDVAMVQRRLAIIDLQTGDQPLYATNDEIGPDPSRSALVANGEIYNYVEMRRRMGEETFQTRSDCEPAVRRYVESGIEFAQNLRGMYAIAIHDPGQRCLVLARDPFGIKPLYYGETEDGFAFASEPQALIAAGLARPVVRTEARDELLQLQFTTGRETIFQGIHRVLPGETMVIRKGRVAERIQMAALPPGDRVDTSQAAALRDLDDVLNDTVMVHQRADVPYGMFLSGGIDSSVLLAMMARLNERPVDAFTISFPGTDAADERANARRVAEAVGANHHEVEFTADDFWTRLPAVVEATDDPTADFALLPTHKLAETVRDHGLKVVLSGEGGDELFAGYGRYRRARRPRWLGGRAMRDRGRFAGLGVLRDESGHWRDGIGLAERQAADPRRTGLQVDQATDVLEWLPNDLLNKVDRCLMAFGVEGRVPFLDPKMADFAYRLPDNLKFRRGRGKWLLRRWLETALPAARPYARKQGFTVPVGEWIERRGAALGPLVARQPGIVEACYPGSVEALFAAPTAAAKQVGLAKWTLLFYALWHHRHILNGGMAGDVFDVLGEAGNGAG